MKKIFLLFWIMGGFVACKKETPTGPITGTPPSTGPFNFISNTVNGNTSASFIFYSVSNSPVVSFTFSEPIDSSTVNASVSFKDNSGTVIQTKYSYSKNDSTLYVQPSSPLKPITKYTIEVDTTLKSTGKVSLQTILHVYIITAIDSSNKFPVISDSDLLTLVQQQTFNYFWTFGHPVSGMARERTSSGDLVTTGGSGFGVMAMLVGVERNFITRADALTRISTMVSFLTNNVTRYHGAFPHWLNGATGVTIPFSTQDDGGDIVETSYMMQGLLCARQYFSSTTDSDEINLRTSINNLWNGVDWNWYRQNDQNVLYWNWSPDYGWAINAQVAGWCEALITYVLAASANSDSIPPVVYTNGWAGNGTMENGKSFYGITLPLGPDYGGPLFFEHYSFMGINPNNLSDAYANYWTQDTAHSKINYLYCVNNPHGFNGYSSSCWGLTASDENNNGYSAHSPTNDDGVITPTAAISSMPYTPTESMNALKFFYYQLGDKIWGQYGFIDAFNLSNIWFDSDCLAIDQGPQIVMIENYRSGLLWNLFMSCPEIKHGMKQLGFQSPYLN